MRFINPLITGGGAPPCRNSEKCKGEILSEDTLWPNQFLNSAFASHQLRLNDWNFKVGMCAYFCSISNLKLWFSLHQLCKHLRAHIACGTSYWWKLVKVQPMLVVWPVREPAIPQKELGVGTSRFGTFPRSFHEFKQVFTCFYQNDNVVMFWIGCDCSDIPVLSIFKHSNRITQHFMAIQSHQRRQIESYGGFHTWGYRQIIHLNRIFHCKPSILGYPIYGTPHMGPSESIQFPIRHLLPRQVAGRQWLGEDHGLDTLACASWRSELQHQGAWRVQTWWAASAVALGWADLLTLGSTRRQAMHQRHAIADKAFLQVVDGCHACGGKKSCSKAKLVIQGRLRLETQAWSQGLKIDQPNQRVMVKCTMWFSCWGNHSDCRI